MSDLIDRNDAIEAIEFEKVYITAYKGNGNSYVSEGNPLKQYNKGLDDAIKVVNSLAPAELEQKWIPISECLPEDENEVIVTVCDKSGCTPDYYSAIGIYSTHLNCWIVDMISENVIAWMPLPEPYRGDR